MASLKKVKCPYCSFTNTKEKVINHIELKHEDMIPQGFTAARVLFNFINKKDHGTCVICKGNTAWNEKTNKYNRLCNKPECKNKLREIYKKNMLKVYGKTTLLNDPEQQKKMLANRSISGVYKFSNGKIKEYTGSFEKKFLQFMDTMMGYDPDDIIMPGPTLEYEYNGEKHQWITDALIVPYNLIIEVKDGGDFKNNRSMVSYREKQVAKEEMITNMGKYNYLRLTNNQFGQLIDILYDLKMQMIDDSEENKKTIVKIHESLNELDMTNGQKVYKRYLEIHKRRLKDSFNSRIIPLKNALLLSEEECYELRDRILKHDKSRMSDEEFEPLRKAKFPEDEQEKKEGKKEKDAAWKHHYALNDHHPEHWKGKEIPNIVIAEMIIDWETDCRHDGGNPLNWYLNTKEGIETQKKINPKTRLIIERVLKTIYNIDMNLKDNYDRNDDPVAVKEDSNKIYYFYHKTRKIESNGSYEDAKKAEQKLTKNDKKYFWLDEKEHPAVIYRYNHYIDGKVVGIIRLKLIPMNKMLKPFKDGLFIDIMVIPEYRNKGVSQLMLDKAIQWFNNQSEFNILCYAIDNGNEVSEKFIKKQSDFKLYSPSKNYKRKIYYKAKKGIKIIKESIYTDKIIEKVKEYEEYIKEHIQNVRNSYNDRKSKIQLVLGLSEGDMQELENRIKNHDNSKWSNDEFDAYRRHFHSVSDKEKEDSEEDFKKAWKHHYMVNDHHPEYWKNTDMPNIAIAELICDWEAMGRKFGGNPLEYFEKNKDKLKAKMNEYSYNAIYNALKNIYDIKMDLKESVNNESSLNSKILEIKPEDIRFIKDLKGSNNSYIDYKGKHYRIRVETLIINEDNKIYVQKKDKPTAYGAMYKLPGGSAEPNTEFIIQAENEIHEEAMLTVKNIYYTGYNYISIYGNKEDPYQEKYLTPLGFKYEGSITYIYIAEYVGKYHGYVKIIDRTSMAKEGKFYEFKSIKWKFEHKKALDDYFKSHSKPNKQSSTNESAEEEKEIINSMSKKEQWYLDSPRKNIVFHYIHKINGKPAGFIDIMKDTMNDKKGLYIDIGVKPEYRGFGVANKLMDTAVSWFDKQNEYDNLRYYLNFDNNQSLNFIKKNSKFKLQEKSDKHKKYIFIYSKINKKSINEDFLNPKMLNFTFDKDIYINYDKPYKVYKCYPYAFYDYNLPRLKVDPMVMNQNKKLAIYGCIYLMTKGATGSNTFKPLEIKKSWWEKHKRDRVYWIESKKYHEYKGQLIVDGTNKNNYKAIVTTLDKIIHTECKDSVKLIII